MQTFEIRAHNIFQKDRFSDDENHVVGLSFGDNDHIVHQEDLRFHPFPIIHKIHFT